MKQTLKIEVKGRTLILSERYRNHDSRQYYTDALRSHNMCLIQRVTADGEQQLALLMAEMKRRYTDSELEDFARGDGGMMEMDVLHSLQVQHPEMTIATVRELFDRDELHAVMQKVLMLEGKLEAIDEKKNPMTPAAPTGQQGD